MIVAHISDPHLAHQGEVFAGEAALHRAVAHLTRLPSPPDAVLLTGDLADGGRPEEYARVKAALAPLPMPVYAVPGNHDDRGAFLAAFGPQGESALDGSAQYVVDPWPLRLIALDTLLPGQAAGELGAAQLDWLEARLGEDQDRPTLLFMHHPPIHIGLPISDEIALRDVEAFAALVARHPQIEAVVAGHVHTTLTHRFAGTLAHSVGSTKEEWLYDLTQPGRLVARLDPPRCLLHVWDKRTGLVTHSSLIGQEAPLTVLHDGEHWV